MREETGLYFDRLPRNTWDEFCVMWLIVGVAAALDTTSGAK